MLYDFCIASFVKQKKNVQSRIISLFVFYLEFASTIYIDSVLRYIHRLRFRIILFFFLFIYSSNVWRFVYGL